MRLLPLGSTNLLVSEIGFGAVEIGMDYGIPTRDKPNMPAAADSARLLNEALDLGVNFIDTARIYGKSEAIIGEALCHRRDEYILSTKIIPLGWSDLKASDLYARVHESIGTSLRALKTDHVDLLLLHSAPVELLRDMDQLQEILEELKRKGYCRFVGASVYEDGRLEALGRDGLNCLQIAYNALDRSAEEDLLPRALKNGVGIVARSVLLKGAITWRYRELPDDLSELRAAAASLERLAAEAGMSLPEMAFRYVLSSGVVGLCGTAHLEELQATISYADHGPLGTDLIKEIRKVGVVDRRLLNPGNWSIP
jgi:aryl-alcohol dehydrogenase-like predicted oxidoreductase